MCEDTDTVYWVWLNELMGLPLSAKRKLLQTIGNPKEIFQASLGSVTEVLSKKSLYALAGTEGVKEPSLVSVWTQRSLKTAESILESNGKYAINIVCASDSRYRHIFNADPKAPLMLYYRGTLSPSVNPVVGVIGSRSCTSYGKMVTRAAVTDLVQNGSIIASGLSFGIDALAHQTTLEHLGVTYAFVPCGLHKAQPASHTALMERIADTGAVITPYAIGKEALPFRFMGRNNILVSWCDTLLVIEARTRSGSMDIARSALKKGKRVLAVPNSLLEPMSCGTNQLLAEGAQAYLNDRLFLDNRPVPDDHSVLKSSAQHGEEEIIKALSKRALTTSEIGLLIPGSDLSVMECLSEMEIADRIMFRPDGKWHLVGGL